MVLFDPDTGRKPDGMSPENDLPDNTQVSVKPITQPQKQRVCWAGFRLGGV